MRQRRLLALALGSVVVLVSSTMVRGGIQADDASVGPGSCSGNQSVDFDNNDAADLAIGVPGEGIKGKKNAGAVNILYGSSSSEGLQATGENGGPASQFWTEADLMDRPERNDRFGRCVAGGYFNDDEFGDLAIGSPGQAVNGKQFSGGVHVLYGTQDGLNASGHGYFTQDTEGIAGDGAQTGDEWGSALAAGDFNNDGLDDLAVGAPLDNSALIDNAGSVTILYGTDAGLGITGSQFFTQATDGVADDAEKDDKFGASLATGNANDGTDNFDDLAIGVTEEDLPTGEKDAGAVHVFYGSAAGLTPAMDELWSQNRGSVLDEAEQGDNFGWAVAFGDFDDDGVDDLAIGTPKEDIDGAKNAGIVNVLYGTNIGLSDVDNEVWHQNNSGAGNQSEKNDFFGASLVADDFQAAENDEDLAIGVPGERVDGHKQAGAVEIIYGDDPNGLTGPGQHITQNTPEVEDTAEKDDHFGLSVSAGSFDQDNHGDLAIGIPGENLNGKKKGQGAVAVIYAEPAGITPTATPPDEFWHQNVEGVEDKAETNDLFGRSLG